MIGPRQTFTLTNTGGVTSAFPEAIIAKCLGATQFVVRPSNGAVAILLNNAGLLWPNWTGLTIVGTVPTTPPASGAGFNFSALESNVPIDAPPARAPCLHFYSTGIGQRLPWPSPWASMFLVMTAIPVGSTTVTVDVWPEFLDLPGAASTAGMPP